jgi:phosphoribosylformylglycinamidine synthase
MTDVTTTPSAPAGPEPLHRRLGVTDGELDVIREKLGRDPNHTELAMFSVMWSEHCSYKSSKPLLKTLPTRGSGMMAGIGDNAGVVRIGDGLAVAFKIESHNHPSAVEPYQGAATGVGGILRDIFTMGARPIAVLDALRFGDPTDPRTRHLVDGIVRGVGGYGNCVGVPTVGGELVFDPSYQGNPLVNVMAIGLLEERMLILAEAPGPGNYVVLFGSTTGRDGIGGASVLASATFQDDDPNKRPTVQVGDPFAEKLLIEASLELIDRRLVEGIQDLGAGGISCAASESADKAGTGILLDLDAIPRREPGMAPWEVMISESQERMLATCRPENYPAVREVCDRWGIPIALVGRVTTDGDIAIVEGGIDPDGEPNPSAKEIARVPARALTSDAIVHYRAATPPARRRESRSRPTTASPNVAWTRPPSSLRSSAAPTCRAAAGCMSSTTPASRATPSSGRVMGPRCCESRARGRRSWPPPTATRPSARWIRTWAPSSRWRKRREMSASPGLGRSASRTASTTATRSAPRRSGSFRKRSGVWARPAAPLVFP